MTHVGHLKYGKPWCTRCGEEITGTVKRRQSGSFHAKCEPGVWKRAKPSLNVFCLRPRRNPEVKMRGPKKPAVCDDCGIAFLHKAPRWIEKGKQYHRECAPQFKMACEVVNNIVRRIP